MPPRVPAGKARADLIPIDPDTRDVVQTVYIRKVEKVGGKLVNVEIASVRHSKIR